MKTLVVAVLVVVMLLPLSASKVRAQEHETAVLILNIEKLNQLREILQRMYDGYKVVSDGYTKIKNLTSGNFDLHSLFLDGLMLVSPTVKKYHRVVGIVDHQLRIIKEYKAAYRRFQRSKSFNPEQLVYLAEVYGRLLDDSLKSLDELLMVITARTLRMTDDDRLRAIDRIHRDVEKQLGFLRRFNTQQTMLAIARTKEAAELQTLKGLHGIK